MAKKEDADAPKGRLLFTDFAISEKGRPPGLSLSPTVATLAKPLPTLRDVISAIDIRFDDDDDDREALDFSSLLDDDRQEGEAAPDPFLETLTEDKRDGEPESAAEEPDRAAPLDGFLSTFTPHSETATDTIRGEETARDDDTELDLDFAFASLLAPRAKKGPGKPLAPPADENAAGVPKDEAWIDVVNGALDNIGPEDDILSLMPPENGEMTDVPTARRDATRIQASSPRTRSYGGIERVENWYTPPKQNDGEEQFSRPAKVEDWYEPPTSAKQSPAVNVEETAVLGSADELFGGVDIDKAWRARTVPERADGTDTDTADELFAEFANLLGQFPSHGKTAVRAPAAAASDTDELKVDILSEVKPEESARFRQARLAAAGAEDALPEAKSEPAGETAFSKTRVLPEPQAKPEPAGETPFSKTRVLPEREAKVKRQSVRIKAVPPAETHTDIRIDLDFDDDDGQIGPDSPDNAIADATFSDKPSANALDAVTAGETPAAATSTHDEEAEEEPVSLSAGAVIFDAPGIDASSGDASRDDLQAATQDAGDEKPDSPVDSPAGAFSGIGDPEENIGVDDLDSLVDVEGACPVNPNLAPPVISDDDVDMETGRFRKSAAAEDDYLPGSEGLSEDGSADSDSAEEPEEEEVAVNPMDVFANMDALDDFGDDALDDEMLAMLDDDGEEAGQAGATEAAGAAIAVQPRELGRIGRIVAKITDRLPIEKVRRINTVLAWRENWWFYCDLVAAIIAAASLAVIASYFMWYR